jgi:hypothetical protein
MAQKSRDSMLLIGARVHDRSQTAVRNKNVFLPTYVLSTFSLSVIASHHSMMRLGVGTIIVVFLAVQPTASQAEAIAHQDETQQQHDTVVYQDVPSEYCYNENFNLNHCLKKQQHELINYSQDKVSRCTHCTSAIEATIMGYETCDELNLMNTVVSTEEEGSTTNSFSNINETDTINWKESLCVSYNTCVQTNCPTQCQSEQSLWLKCLIVIMNCNWHCPTTSIATTTTTNTMAWNNVEEGKAVTPHGMVLSATSSSSSSSLLFTTMNNGNAWVMSFILILIVGVVIFCVVTSILNNRERSGSVLRKQQQQQQQQEEEDTLGSRSGDIEFT